MTAKKPWTLKSPRLLSKCPYCGKKHRVAMEYTGYWKVIDLGSPTPVNPSLYSPDDDVAPETAEGDSDG